MNLIGWLGLALIVGWVFVKTAATIEHVNGLDMWVFIVASVLMLAGTKDRESLWRADDNHN